MRTIHTKASSRECTRTAPFAGARLANAIVVLLLVNGAVRATHARATGPMHFERAEATFHIDGAHAVLPGFLLGGEVANLAVVYEAPGAVRLRLYALSDTAWTVALDTELGDDVLFVDVARVAGTDRLLTYGDGQLRWFDPVTLTHRRLVAADSVATPALGAVAHVDISHDVNGDGLDDLVMLTQEGFNLTVQERDGGFAPPLRVGRPVRLEPALGGDGTRYDPWGQGRVHEIDYDHDGRRDLVFWREGQFVAHLQTESGRFAVDPITFPSPVRFDSDDPAALAAPYGVRRRRMDHQPTGAITGRILQSLADHNGAGIADLTVFELKGGGLWRIHSSYEVHYGEAADGGTSFTPSVSAAVNVDGIPFDVTTRDVDGDGRPEVAYTVIAPGIFKAFGMLVTAFVRGYVSMDLAYYRLDAQQVTRPAARTSVRTHPSGESGGRTSYPAVLLGDMTGDGRPDLLLQHDDEELRLHAGVAGGELLSGRPQKIRADVPHTADVSVADLDGDGTQDLIIHRPASARVTTLLAR